MTVRKRVGNPTRSKRGSIDITAWRKKGAAIIREWAEVRHHSRERNKRRRNSSQSIARRRQRFRNNKKRLLHSKQSNEKRRQSNLGNEKRPRHQRTVRFKNNGQDIYDDQPNESPIIASHSATWAMRRISVKPTKGVLTTKLKTQTRAHQLYV